MDAPYLVSVTSCCGYILNVPVSIELPNAIQHCATYFSILLVELDYIFCQKFHERQRKIGEIGFPEYSVSHTSHDGAVVISVGLVPIDFELHAEFSDVGITEHVESGHIH